MNYETIKVVDVENGDSSPALYYKELLTQKAYDLDFDTLEDYLEWKGLVIVD